MVDDAGRHVAQAYGLTFRIFPTHDGKRVLDFYDRNDRPLGFRIRPTLGEARAVARRLAAQRARFERNSFLNPFPDHA